jgi:aminoglycoside phosphotransferase (APT) family kinase protein
MTVNSAAPGERFALQRSSRDGAALAAAVADWLHTQLPDGAAPEVTFSGASDANGMSSETILADVRWTEGGTRRSGEYVVRMAPSAADVPVFAAYGLDHQYDTLRLVHELTDVAVPAPRWLESTGDVVGAPFFFMERVDGLVPPDVMPYTFGDNWFFHASSEEQRRLQDGTVAAIAGLHQIADAGTTFAFLDEPGPDDHALAGATPLRRLFEKNRAWYEWAVGDAAFDGKGRSSLIDRAIGWLDAHWPAADAPGNVVLSWGDARVGNVLYRDFAPVAVLDWEMAGLGPRELDLGWLVFAHRVFQSHAETFGLPGLPDVLREDDVRATYAELTGVEVGDLQWFQIYSAVIWGVVFLRTGTRQAHFGEIQLPDDIDALMHHAPLFGALLEEAGA